MLLKRICISNFKSFKNISVDLNNFDVLIGPNASGKSNFIQILKFLKDTLSLGLKNSISIQGGTDFIRNINCSQRDNLSMKFVFNVDTHDIPIKVINEKNILLLSIKEFEYDLELSMGAKKGSFDIVRDFITLNGLLRSIKESEKKEQFKIIFQRDNGRISIKITPKGIPLKRDDIIFPIFQNEKIDPKELLLRWINTRTWYLRPILNNIENISIYDFDPKLSKKAIQITGKASLEEDGSNLSIVLRSILEDRYKKKQFIDLIKDFLPFVQKVNIDKFADKSVLLKLSETYFKNIYLPATFLSDGTVNITALIIALLNNESFFTVIEEPERNIHPNLISKLISFVNNISEQKQVLLTTHNPEIIKYAGVNNLLLIKRDNQGFSTISRPKDNKEVQTFLKNEIGIDELFVQNLL